MISKEELLSNPENWESTENLNLDVFDEIEKKVGGSYFLKKKNSEKIYFGHYNPENKYFECHQSERTTKLKIIPTESIELFIALPPVKYDPPILI